MKRRQDSIDDSEHIDHDGISEVVPRTNTKCRNRQVLIPTPYYQKPFKQLRSIGKGSHSSCLEVVHPEGDIFAMKVISIDETRSRSLIRKSSGRTSGAIMREIQIQKLVSSNGKGGAGTKNVVTFYEELRLSTDDSRTSVGLILEYCPNGSLYEYITSRGIVLREWEARRVLLQLCGGAAWLHQKHIVHGDLKLSNLLLDRRCDLKICDFGHSFVVTNEELGVDDKAYLDIAGTPNYLAPEVVDCILNHGNGNKCPVPKKISYEIDIWAIGVCLYAMLIGTPPFQTNFSAGTEATMTTTLEDVYRRICQVELTYPPPEQSMALSDSVKALIENILVKEPYGRLSILEIVADKWLRESHFPDKLSLGGGNISLDTNFDNRKSILNFKRCLVKSGFRHLLNGLKTRSSKKTGKKRLNQSQIKRRGMRTAPITNITTTLDTDAVSDISLLSQQIGKALENHAINAKSIRLDKLNRSTPSKIRYTSNISCSTVASQVLTSHRRVTLTTLVEYELIVKCRVQTGPQYTITNIDTVAPLGDTSISGPHIVASKVSEEDNDFSYRLSDGSLGLLSNETGHTVLVNRQARRMWYIVPDTECGWLGKCFDLDKESMFPEELSNRLAVAEMSASHLANSNSSLELSATLESDKQLDEDIFVRGVTIFEDGLDTKFYELSNGSFQFEFSSKQLMSNTTVLLQNNGELVTTVSSMTGIREQWHLWEFLQQCELDPGMRSIFQHMKRYLAGD